MKKILIGLSAFLTAFVVTITAANAAYISQFNKSTNDGVYSLTAEQAIFFGEPTAAYIGFYRIREGKGLTWSAGDTYDASSLMNSVTSGASNILGLFNGLGDAALISYTGTSFDRLGTSTILVDTPGNDDVPRSVAFLFGKDVGNIVYRGTSTFNQGQTRGALEYQLSAVPLPAGLALYGAGLAAMGFIGWRARRKKAELAAA